jgi:hypothetical protein
MSGITLAFGDGEYNFFLPWAACAEIERKSGNTPIMQIYARVASGQASTSDIVETIRQGLMGGSGGIADGQSVDMKPHVANALVERYVTGSDRCPISESWQVAEAVLAAALVGYEPAQEADGSKKKKAKA